MPKQALAWDWLSAGLALFQVGAEYAYLNKQVAYLDNKGRFRSRTIVRRSPTTSSLNRRISSR